MAIKTKTKAKAKSSPKKKSEVAKTETWVHPGTDLNLKFYTVDFKADKKTVEQLEKEREIQYERELSKHKEEQRTLHRIYAYLRGVEAGSRKESIPGLATTDVDLLRDILNNYRSRMPKKPEPLTKPKK